MRDYYEEIVLPAFTAIGLCIAVAVYGAAIAVWISR